MKTLVLAEKPSVGKDIGRVLGCKSSSQGSMEGSKYIVTWALGHLVTLKDPEEYDKKYKAWNMDVLPIMPEKLGLTVIPKTSKQYSVVKNLMLRKDVSTIVIATDAGREGELVARWIIEKAGVKKPIKRLWISSVTDKAIKDGFNNLKDGKNYINLCNSAKARAESDWLVGINATRCLTTKFNSQLSCGRVQTPTIAIIEKRENDIRTFKPVDYYGITLDIQADNKRVNLTWQDLKSGDTRSFNKDKIDKILSSLSGKDGNIDGVSKTKKKTMPPTLYDLTELQRDASKRYGFSPKETLNIMQGLYEHHKVLTYPRTDSKYISKDIIPTIKDRLKACSVGNFRKVCSKLLRENINTSKHFVDDTKVSDHHAIIPTEEFANYSDFNDRERKIYDLVVTRFLGVFFPPFEYEQTIIRLHVNKEIFIAKGKTVIKEGFKEINGLKNEDEEEELTSNIREQILPKVNHGDKFKISNVKLTNGRTKPPAPFSESTLLSAMENPKKFMDIKDVSISKILGETGGLGTVATRADIIEKLFDSFYLEKKGNDIFTTSKGRQILKLVPKDLKTPELTGVWEQKLTMIANGKLNKDKFLTEIRDYTKAIIVEIKNSNEVYRHDNLSTKKCPECEKFMLEVNGKKGKMLVCQDRECGHRQSLSLITNARCPNCHKKLEITGEGDARRVNCPCGHRESYDVFSKRMAENKNRPTKKDTEKFLKDLNKKEEKNNPLADALKGFKFD